MNARNTRRPSPFRVGDRVRQSTDGPGLLAARSGVVIRVLEQFGVYGHHAYQNIEVEYDPNPAFRATGTIGPWLGFIADPAAESDVAVAR